MTEPKRKWVGILLSAILVPLFWLVPLPGEISPDGQRALAVTIFAILWWVFNVVHPAYTALLSMAAFVFLQLAEPAVVFRLWSLPLMWMILASFLIAAAVTKSGLARRVAYFFMSRYATSYKNIIVLIYILGLTLSFLIPQPFPRALLMMSVVRHIIQLSGCSRKDSSSLGFAVFSSLTATSIILLTGDVLLNLAAVGFSGEQIGWLEWLRYMAVPGLAASLLMMGLHFLVFRPEGRINVDQAALKVQSLDLGPMSRKEKVTLGWVMAALLLWGMDSITGVDPAWVAVVVVVGLSLPKIGDVLEVGDISTGVSWPIIIFITGAFAIGAVGLETGLSAWLADILLPADPPGSAFAFSFLISAGTMFIHMFIGSALATMSVVAPAMVGYAASAGWSPVFPALLIYTTVQIHYLLPFPHVTILLGEGETGGYSISETLRFGIPLTVLTFVVILFVEIPWWKLIGL
ncbi:MAG: SLC13 family permease, partial [Anaerolineaceae bacterium]|nr:SLC13 family permease [Anaerolineaceae bacterium]